MSTWNRRSVLTECGRVVRTHSCIRTVRVDNGSTKFGLVSWTARRTRNVSSSDCRPTCTLKKDNFEYTKSKQL